MLARSASAAKLPAKKVRPSSGQTRAKRMMSHSESAPTFKNRPSSATDGRGRRTEALATGLPYQPLAPRVGFMEKTSGALGQVKRALTKSNLLKPPKHKAKLFPLKKEFNVLRRQLEVKEKKLAQLQNDLLYLQPTEEELQREEHCQARIKNLNMKLVTLNTRLVEAEENKKNYELYILRMKEEDVQLSKQIDHLRNLVTEYDRLLSKMSRMNKRVSGQKVDIDGEIHKFHLDIDGFAGFAGETIQKYRGIVHARQLARTEDQTHQSTTGKAKKKMIAAQQQLAEESQQEEAAEVGAELDGWQGKVEYYEKRYHKISAATGLMRPEDIVNKFFFNDEITADLEQEIATRKTTLAALRAAQAEAAGELTAKKAGYMPTKWKDVDQIHASYQQEAKRSTRDQRALERHLSIHAMVVEGLTNVSATLTEVVGPHPAPTFLETPPNQDPGQASQYWCSRLDQEISNFLEHSVIMNRKHEARLAVEQREEAKLSTLNKERQLSTHTKAALSGFQGTSQTGSLPVTEGTDHGDYSDEYDD